MALSERRHSDELVGSNPPDCSRSWAATAVVTRKGEVRRQEDEADRNETMMTLTTTMKILQRQRQLQRPKDHDYDHHDDETICLPCVPIYFSEVSLFSFVSSFLMLVLSFGDVDRILFFPSSMSFWFGVVTDLKEVKWVGNDCQTSWLVIHT